MERKYNMLVCFSKYEKDTTGEPIEEQYKNVEEGKVIDIQYHYFKNCPGRIEFIWDPIYRAFRDKGYLWSAIEFPEELADKCMFTKSEYERR